MGAIRLPPWRQIGRAGLPSSGSGDKHLALVFGQMMALPQLSKSQHSALARPKLRLALLARQGCGRFLILLWRA